MNKSLRFNMRHKKGSLVITLIMLSSLVMFTLAMMDFLVVDYRASRGNKFTQSALHIAEAGLNRTVDVLMGGSVTPPYGLTQNFGGGTFTVSADRSGNEITVTSTGSVEGVQRRISQKIQVTPGGGLPGAFDYAIFTNNHLTLSGNATATGDMYVNGNAAINNNARVLVGEVYHSGTISGAGVYTDGGTPNPLPNLPVLDTSPYTAMVRHAQLYGVGSRSYSGVVNLGGNTVYVNGSVTVSGNVVFTGTGTICATGPIQMSGNLSTVPGNVQFISGHSMAISGNTTFSQVTLYAPIQVAMSGNNNLTNQSSIISDGNVAVSGNGTISGVVYGRGSVGISGNKVVRGAVVAGAMSGGQISGNVSVIHTPQNLPPSLPGFSQGSLLSIVPGSFRQY